MSHQPIVAILLAAGAGTRFGGGKLLHPLDDGVPIAAHAVRNLRAADLQVIAITRPGDRALVEMLEQEGCNVRECAESVNGMGHSVAHGVAASPHAAGWIVALGDMPRVKPSTVQLLADAITAGSLIAVPEHDGSDGHPRAFGAPLRDELLGLTGDMGARAVIERRRKDIRRVPVNDSGVLLDVDARIDLERLAPDAAR